LFPVAEYPREPYTAERAIVLLLYFSGVRFWDDQIPLAQRRAVIGFLIAASKKNVRRVDFARRRSTYG
jgi:hypothetical protein